MVPDADPRALRLRNAIPYLRQGSPCRADCKGDLRCGDCRRRRSGCLPPSWLNGGEQQSCTDPFDRRSDRTGVGQLREGRFGQGERTRRRGCCSASEYTGRSQHQHARDHRRCACLAHSCDRLRRSLWSPCGQRRDLYSLCDPYRGHGARHQHRCRDAGADRRAGTGSAEHHPGQGRQRQEGRRPPARVEGCHDGKGDE